MNSNQKKINVITGAVFCAVFFMCMSNNIVGPLLSNIMQHYTISLDGGGLMSMFQNIGGTMAILLLLFIMDKFNKTLAFIIPMSLLAISMLFIGTAPPYTFFMILFLFFGISFSTMDMVGNAIVPDIQQEKSNTALSLMHGIASIGAVLAPMIAGGFIEAGTSWQYVYTTVGCFILFFLVLYVLAYMYARKAIRAIKVEHLDKKEKGVFKKFLKDKYVWAAAGCMLMFGGYQSGIVVWSSQYFKDIFGSAPVAAGLGLTAYWLGTGIIRLLFGITPLKKLDTRPVVIYGSIASGIVLLLGILAHNYSIMLACVFLSGCLNAPVIPRLVGLVSGWYRQNSGLASGSLFASLYLAYSFIPLLMGTVAYTWGMNALMLVPVVCTVLAGMISVFLPKGLHRTQKLSVDTSL